MPKLSPTATPKYRKHKASGQAVVTIDGKDHYLGRHGTKASEREYDRLIAEWIANGRTVPTSTEASITIMELLAAYLRFAKVYYRGSDEHEQITYTIRPLKALYGRTPAAEFSPLKLKAVRQRMIEGEPAPEGEQRRGLARSEINKRIGRIKRVFRWGVENEMVPPYVLHGLQAVVGLARGRSEARETAPVKPAPEAFVDAVKPHVSAQVWAMIQLQRFTGMRPGEVTTMRSCDIDTSGAVWIYTPASHKTAHRGHERKIYIGPRGQAVLRPWLKTELTAFLFSAREAMEAKRAARQRKTPLSCGNRPGTNRKAKPKKQPGERYTPRSYHQAIRKACLKADVPQWHPHQLRHNAATWLRKEFGLDVARVVLGHRSAAVTEVYAELDQEKAKEVMGLAG
jgi:integrase